MVKIAILGFGTVGSGVAEVIETNQASIAARAGDGIEVKYVVDIRDFPDSPWADRVVHDFALVEQDPEVSIVVETIGGARVAYDFTKRALLAGKSVVTSNKELVATHGAELMTIAREKKLSYLFEASVGGGIPIIRPIHQCLAANEINEICGILNGTTNYILTKMEKTGGSFAAILKEAQALGYAEADPTADVEGIDSCRKISILASLAFGQQVNPDTVFTKGISSILPEDIAAARKAGFSIKLLGRAQRLEGGRICAFVAPHLVPEESPLQNVDDVFNAIVVSGNAAGDLMFYGRGAGKLPTASAVVADVIDAVRSRDTGKRIGWEETSAEQVVSPDDLLSRWYIRTRGDCSAFGDKVTVLDAPGDLTMLITNPISKARLRSYLKLMNQGTEIIRVL